MARPLFSGALCASLIGVCPAGCVKSLPSAPAREGTVRFAVIGDYGSALSQARDVAALVRSWEPDFIATVGDNNYPRGAATTIDRNIGSLYHDFIGAYRGRFGRGARENRFFPIPGHRDWDSDGVLQEGQSRDNSTLGSVAGLRPYLEFFTLPGNERYYELERGPVHLFMLDTDVREPDGATVTSAQAAWLRAQLGSSKRVWKLVFAHHAPYTSHRVPDVDRMRWPFAAWGASAVLSGYFHVYERLLVEGIPYFVVGVGGSTHSDFGEVDARSRFRYNDDYGALLVDADEAHLTFRFVNRRGVVVDSFSVLPRR